jgi:hypothetical protein
MRPRPAEHQRDNANTTAPPALPAGHLYAPKNIVTITDLTSRAEHLARAQRLVSYRVSITPPGNVRVSTRFRFTQLSSAVKNGVPPPTRTG